MIRQAAFIDCKRHLKGGLHCHTTRSDGKATPEETIAKIDAVTLEGTMELARRLLSASPSAAIVGKDAQKYLDLIGG